MTEGLDFGRVYMGIGRPGMERGRCRRRYRGFQSKSLHGQKHNQQAQKKSPYSQSGA